MRVAESFQMLRVVTICLGLGVALGLAAQAPPDARDVTFPNITTTTTTTSSSPSLTTGTTTTPSASSDASNTSGDGSDTDCTTLQRGDTATYYHFLPNTTTVTLTVTPGVSQAFTTPEEISTPVYCSLEKPHALGEPPKVLNTMNNAKSTAYITAKSAVTVYTTASPADFPSVTNNVKTKDPASPNVPTQNLVPQAQNNAVSINAASQSSGNGNPPVAESSSAKVSAASVGSDGSASAVVVSGVSVDLSPSRAIIGSNTITNLGSTSTVVTADGQKFTVNPSQVIGAGTTMSITPSAQAVAATTTVVNGVTMTVGSSSAVIEGQTYAIGNGAPLTTIVDHGKTVSIGPSGVGISNSMVSPQSVPTNFAVLGASPISAVGSTIAVINSQTFTYGPNEALQTDVYNGVTITIEPSGIHLAQTTIGGSANTGLQLGLVGGISITEIDSNTAIISQTTFTIGPGVTPTVATIGGTTISAGTNGLGVQGTVLSYPFNPVTTTITAGGMTFVEVGSTLAVFAGNTFTFGPGASTTSAVVSGQTISLGPGGIGFASTTFTGASATASPTGRRSQASILRPWYGLIGCCIAFGVGIVI